jgi:hypothetical protein
MMTEPLPARTDQEIADDLCYANTLDFARRGYPFFERALASLVKDPTCLWDYRHFGAQFGTVGSESRNSASLTATVAEPPTFSDLKTRMRVKRPPPMSPARFDTELSAAVRSGELMFSVPMDERAVIEMYSSMFVAAFEEYAYATCSLADAEGHLFYTDCGCTRRAIDRRSDAPL